MVETSLVDEPGQETQSGANKPSDQSVSQCQFEPDHVHRGTGHRAQFPGMVLFKHKSNEPYEQEAYEKAKDCSGNCFRPRGFLIKVIQRAEKNSKDEAEKKAFHRFDQQVPRTVNHCGLRIRKDAKEKAD